MISDRFLCRIENRINLLRSIIGKTINNIYWLYDNEQEYLEYKSLNNNQTKTFRHYAPIRLEINRFHGIDLMGSSGMRGLFARSLSHNGPMGESLDLTKEQLVLEGGNSSRIISIYLKKNIERDESFGQFDGVIFEMDSGKFICIENDKSSAEMLLVMVNDSIPSKYELTSIDELEINTTLFPIEYYDLDGSSNKLMVIHPFYSRRLGLNISEYRDKLELDDLEIGKLKDLIKFFQSNEIGILDLKLVVINSKTVKILSPVDIIDEVVEENINILNSLVSFNQSQI